MSKLARAVGGGTGRFSREDSRRVSGVSDFEGGEEASELVPRRRYSEDGRTEWEVWVIVMWWELYTVQK